MLVLSFFKANSQQGASLNFENSNASVRLDNSFNLANQSFTIEFWGKSISNGSNHTFIGNGRITNATRLFIGFLNGSFYADFANNQLISSVNSSFLWHHYAITYDASTGVKTFYLDGVFKATSTTTSSFSSTAQIRLGVANNSAYLNGSMDELRFWNVVLSEAEINSRMNCELTGNEPNLKAYYRFNQGLADQFNTNENVLIDNSVNGFNGNLINFLLSGTASNWVSDFGVASGNECSTLSVNEFENNNFKVKVFPNPTSGNLVIYSELMIEKICIYNILGEKVHTSNSNDLVLYLNLDGLKSGSYFINVYSNKYIVVKRLIIQ